MFTGRFFCLKGMKVSHLSLLKPNQFYPTPQASNQHTNLHQKSQSDAARGLAHCHIANRSPHTTYYNPSTNALETSAAWENAFSAH